MFSRILQLQAAAETSGQAGEFLKKAMLNLDESWRLVVCKEPSSTAPSLPPP